MKIESPSSITPREASVRLEWISTRVLPGVGVLLLSIPICQWTNSVLPDGIVPIYVIYLLSATVLWSIYMTVQYAFVGIAQTKTAKEQSNKAQTAACEQPEQILLLEAKPITNEPAPIRSHL